MGSLDVMARVIVSRRSHFVELIHDNFGWMEKPVALMKTRLQYLQNDLIGSGRIKSHRNGLMPFRVERHA